MTDLKSPTSSSVRVFELALDRSLRLGYQRVRSGSELLFSLTAALLFGLTFLVDHSNNAYFLYTADVLGFYWPSMLKVFKLVSSFHFWGIDTSMFGGSSDFFLSPNFFSVHPFLIIYSLAMSWRTVSMQMMGQCLVCMIVIHNFLCCYYTVKITKHLYKFPFYAAFFCGISFTYCTNMVDAYGEPELLFGATMVPWVVYASIMFARGPRLLSLLAAACPIIICVLGGYIPLSMADLLLAVALILFQILVLDRRAMTASMTAKRIFRASLPFLVAASVTTPYLIAVLNFFHEGSSSNTGSLFFSAFQLAELPQTIGRIFSIHLAMPGPLNEFSTFWGLSIVTIFAFYILSENVSSRIKGDDLLLIKFMFGTYVILLLSIFGRFSPLSTLVYYLVPQVGTMHVYQRFLLPGSLALCVASGIVLRAIASSPIDVTTRVVASFWIAVMLSAGIVLSHDAPLAVALQITNGILFEIIVVACFSISLLIPGERFRGLSAIIFYALPTMNMIYGGDYYNSVTPYTLSAKSVEQPAMLDATTKARIASYFKDHSSKQVVKYMDLTTMWHDQTTGAPLMGPGMEIFPKSFPYLVLDQVRLMSYGGFNFYLSPIAAYMKLMPVEGTVQQRPNWGFLTSSGADFLVVQRPLLKSLQDAGILQSGPLDSFDLLGDATIVPYHPAAASAPKNVYDDGVFSVAQAVEALPAKQGALEGAAPVVTPGEIDTRTLAAAGAVNVRSNGANLFSIDLDRPSESRVTYQFWPNPRLHYALDGHAISPILQDGLATIDVPAGRHRVEIVYRNWPLVVFWVFEAIFALSLICALAWRIAASSRIVDARRRLTGDRAVG